MIKGLSRGVEAERKIKLYNKIRMLRVANCNTLYNSLSNTLVDNLIFLGDGSPRHARARVKGCKGIRACPCP